MVTRMEILCKVNKSPPKPQAPSTNFWLLLDGSGRISAKVLEELWKTTKHELGPMPGSRSTVG